VGPRYYVTMVATSVAAAIATAAVAAALTASTFAPTFIPTSFSAALGKYVAVLAHSIAMPSLPCKMTQETM